MALKTTKALTRVSGGIVPAGSVWKYTISTDDNQLNYRCELGLFYDEASYMEGKPLIQLQDIEEMVIDGIVRAIGILPIDKESTTPGDFPDWEILFDMMAKNVLISISQLNEEDLEIIGQMVKPPEDE